jgi:hypothetical protein
MALSLAKYHSHPGGACAGMTGIGFLLNFALFGPGCAFTLN